MLYYVAECMQSIKSNYSTLSMMETASILMQIVNTVTYKWLLMHVLQWKLISALMDCGS